MELRHLRYFVAVAEAENITRAAARLHVSQPGLSRQIRDLEAETGLALLERDAKSVRLTEAGKVFLTECRAVLARVEAAVAAARAVAGGIKGEIHVGYAPSLTIQILPQALRRFQEEFPGIRVGLHDLSTEEMLRQLQAGQLDIALAVQPQEKALRQFRFQELARYQMCVAVAPGHPLARRRNINLAGIAAEPLIAYSRKDYPDYHVQLGQLFSRSPSKPRIVEEHEGVTGLLAAVEAGRGIGLVPNCVACMVGPRLKLIPLTPAGPPLVVGAAVLKSSASAVVEKFIAAATLSNGNPSTAKRS